MSRVLFGFSLIIGILAVGWIGSVMAATSTLALIVTFAIASVYSIGTVELFQYRRATSSLYQALLDLGETGTELNGWLDRVDPSLRNSVRKRIEGDGMGLPGPIMAPYLIGLLVMLGLLGTFSGMVETLKGAVIALEGAAEIQAIRAGLAAPIRGLGLAFGTSVAGVAASAMLGLMSTLSRRDRIRAGRLLDEKTTTVFRDYSLSHNRQEAFNAIRMQSRALPELVDKMATLSDKLEQVGNRLMERQDHFHASTKELYIEFGRSLVESHKENLFESIRLAGEHLQPILRDAVSDIRAETQKVDTLLIDSARKNAEALSALLANTVYELNRAWQSGVEANAASNDAMIAKLSGTLFETVEALSTETRDTAGRIQHEMVNLLKASSQLIETREKTETAWIEQHAGRMNELTATLKAELGALQENEARRSETASVRLAELERTLVSHLVQLAKGIEEPMNRLIETAAEVPNTAAEVLSQLRAEASAGVERENRLLEEHRNILGQIDQLTQALASTSDGQRAATEHLVDAAANMLENINQRFTENVGAASSHLSEIVENFTLSAVEMASLADAFGAAVQAFSTTNTTLVETLTGIEASLDKTATRSDEQLAYYVAQAREIVDHCLLSQKEIIEELQQLRPDTTTIPGAGEWKN